MTNTEKAARAYAYTYLEQYAPNVLAAIEADVQAGIKPAKIESTWRRATGHGQMVIMVRLAAEYVAAERVAT